MDLSNFFRTKTQSDDFKNRVAKISEMAYQTNFNLEQALIEEFGLERKDRFLTLVRDNKIDAVLFRPRDRFKTSNAAIDADRDRAAVGFGLFKRRNVDAVAFGESIRDVERGLGSEHLQCPSQKHRACRTVDVVISPDQDLLTGVDGLEYPIDRLAHSF